MTDLHPFPESGRIDAPEAPETSESPRRFRAATYDGAVAAAIAELGQNIQVVEANRIRRGGLGGFFATDLGVEIVVTAHAGSEQQIEPPRAAAGSPTTGDAFSRFAGVDDVLELSDAGLVSLFGHIGRTDRPTDSAAADASAAPSSFAALLARHADAGSGDAQARSDSEDDGAVDAATGFVPTLPTRADDRRRRAEIVDQAERVRTEPPVRTVIGAQHTIATDPDGSLAERGSADSGEQQPTLPPVLPPDRAPDRSDDAEGSIGVIESDVAVTQVHPAPHGPAEDPSATSSDWADTLRIEQEAVRREEIRRQEATQRTLRAEREAALRTVAARRASVDRDLAERQSTQFLGLSVADGRPAANDVAVSDDRTIPDQMTPPANTQEAALADLDDLLRRAGVVIPGSEPTAPASSRSTAVPAPAPDHVATDPISSSAGERSAPTELAAAATDHLVSRLADIVAVDGSCLEDLTRLTVAVTTPDGVVVEMFADVDGQDG